MPGNLAHRAWEGCKIPIACTVDPLMQSPFHSLCSNLTWVIVAAASKAKNSPYFTSFLTCAGIHPGRVEPSSLMEMAAWRVEAPQARRSCAILLEIFALSFLHHAQPKTGGLGWDFRSSLSVHVFSWPPACFRHTWDSEGKSKFLNSSLLGRLVVLQIQWSYLG